MTQYIAFINTKKARELNIILDATVLNPRDIIREGIGVRYHHPNSRQEEEELFSRPEVKELYENHDYK